MAHPHSLMVKLRDLCKSGPTCLCECFLCAHPFGIRICSKHSCTDLEYGRRPVYIDITSDKGVCELVLRVALRPVQVSSHGSFSVGCGATGGIRQLQGSGAATLRYPFSFGCNMMPCMSRPTHDKCRWRT